MKIGTKSLLFGCHQLVLHPLFVFWAWKKLYGRPNWKEFVCIFIHDWGYWGCSDMDGLREENHPVWGARLAQAFLDTGKDPLQEYYYFDLYLYHSRYYAKRYDAPPSRLCWADKLGTALMPTWLWVLLGTLSGEIQEYMNHEKYEAHCQDRASPHTWFEDYKTFVKKLLHEQGFPEYL